PAVGVRERELEDRALGARRLAPEATRDGAEAGETERLRLDPALRERLPDDRVAGRRPLAARRPPRQVQERPGEVMEVRLVAEPGALVHEDAHRDLPATVERAQQPVGRYRDVVEEHLVELGVPGDLDQ